MGPRLSFLLIVGLFLLWTAVMVLVVLLRHYVYY